MSWTQFPHTAAVEGPCLQGTFVREAQKGEEHTEQGTLPLRKSAQRS